MYMSRWTKQEKITSTSVTNSLPAYIIKRIIIEHVSVIFCVNEIIELCDKSV